ncbi:hypothetical protein SKAU_G00158320 [Synaphobranchus kaupii]|uniref:Uncharacterized protein n=1 Tax=Synaphobranchus kaupii TaxID=118154 RepID=A0A9Q1FIG2_SYNKA|nr:hypothetical protein SKAU_G00158320 [Synaphobranchus kaupii]
MFIYVLKDRPTHYKWYRYTAALRTGGRRRRTAPLRSRRLLLFSRDSPAGSVDGEERDTVTRRSGSGAERRL